MLNGGRVHRFRSIDEEAPEGAEFGGGQILLDVPRQLVRPRPVVRSRLVVDNAQPMMQQMTHLPGGVGLITPHTPFGSKLQAIWRYADCGFSLLDMADHNIDVEGLSWAPAGGSVQPDAFDQFEIRLAHARWAPDEAIAAGTLFPRFPQSGLKLEFARNVVDSVPASVPSQPVVHPRARGYAIDPGNLEVTPNGTVLLPFPMNRDVPFAERRYFTWRDGDNRARGGGGGAPVDPLAYATALGLPTPPVPVYGPGQVQTVGLPLLMEFRVPVDAGAIGINGWDFNIAVNSSSRPTFRVFSSGGIGLGGAVHTVQPDSEPTARGGYAPGSTPAGAPTPGEDNVVYLGAIDVITRVSHSHSIWFASDIRGEEAGAPFGGRVYQEPTLEPRPEAQPAGTALRVRFRGASALQYLDGPTAASDNDQGARNPDELADFQVDAFTLDVYGDYYNDLDYAVSHAAGNQNPGITFLGGDDLWKDSVDALRDARYYQVRLTFVGNPENGQVPELSAFAMTWSRP